ncbi:DUF6691 family protein [Roseobacter sp. HKCCA0434]|uniref:DUF6691 family protein n=1 Tax=Roseobacter sp. HKCCA0434 TaxID=3079297 RepID=UPI002905E87F|nr:DUF6691 family protein [Roseobacter sp. HKCCA0434]
MKHLATYAIGLLFGLGISLSGMANPAKVLNFFDLAGTWDPSLAFVMGGALIVAFLGFRTVLARPAPAFAPAFQLPTRRDLDARLIGGAAIFGIGWGIAGFCPGGALPALGTGRVEIFAFVAAAALGIVLARRGPALIGRRATA